MEGKMFEVDQETGWESVPGTKGIKCKLLSGNFNEVNGTGYRTRCIRVEAGGETFEPFTHPYWEEVFLMQGELTSKSEGKTVHAPAYVIRPPDTPHGPLISSAGCVLVEFQYFTDRAVGLSSFLDVKAPNQSDDAL
jgi:hypothetical protein